MSSPQSHIYEYMILDGGDPVPNFGGPQACNHCGAIYQPGTEHTCKPAPQVGGTHYSSKAIQPIEYINANQLNYHQGNIVKYITRYKDKNGIEDLRKALWYIEDLIKLEEQP
jgi:hypothetical protein